jgi:DNA-binding Lrp family transcriptional regulator
MSQTSFDSELDSGLWLSVAELARMKNLSRQSVHERVRRLVETGDLTTRGEGRSLRVNLAQYDLAIGSTGDAAREAGAATKAMADVDAPTSSAFRDAQTREKQYAADLKYLELQQRLGEVAPVAEVKDAAVKMGEAVVNVLTRLPSHTDVLASAFTKSGIPGVRSELNTIVYNMRVEIAHAFGVMAENANPWTIDPVHGIQPPQSRKENTEGDQTDDCPNSDVEQRPSDYPCCDGS